MGRSIRVFEHLTAGPPVMATTLTTQWLFAPLPLARRRRSSTMRALPFPRRCSAPTPGFAASARSNRCGATTRARLEWPQRRLPHRHRSRHHVPDLTLGTPAATTTPIYRNSTAPAARSIHRELIASGLYRAGPNALDGTLGAAYDRIGTSRPVASSGTNANEGHNGAEKNAARAAYPLAPGDMVLMAHLALQCLQLD